MPPTVPPPLPTVLHQQLNVPRELAAEVAALFEVRRLDRREYFLRQGKAGRTLGVLLEGYLRSWSLADEREVTQWIFTPGYLVADLRSLLFDQPARYHVQALVPCRIAVLSPTDYARLHQLVPGWAESEKQFIGRCFGALEERVFSFLSLTARERYEWLHAEHPELFNRVPLQHLASMLGMRPETLSRLRQPPR